MRNGEWQYHDRAPQITSEKRLRAALEHTGARAHFVGVGRRNPLKQPGPSKAGSVRTLYDVPLEGVR